MMTGDTSFEFRREEEEESVSGVVDCKLFSIDARLDAEISREVLTTRFLRRVFREATEPAKPDEGLWECLEAMYEERVGGEVLLRLGSEEISLLLEGSWMSSGARFREEELTVVRPVREACRGVLPPPMALMRFWELERESNQGRE